MLIQRTTVAGRVPSSPHGTRARRPLMRSEGTWRPASAPATKMKTPRPIIPAWATRPASRRGKIPAHYDQPVAVRPAARRVRARRVRALLVAAVEAIDEPLHVPVSGARLAVDPA